MEGKLFLMRMLKKILFKSKIMWGLYQKVKNIKINKLKVRNKGYIRIKKCIQGTGLELIVGDNTVLNDTSIRIHME